MSLYDNRLNRRLTDEDLPYGLTVAQVEAVLKENGYSFYALGLLQDNGTWVDDANYMRGGSGGYPQTGVTIKFDALRDLLLKTADLPNINDPEITSLIASAAESAANVLRQKFPSGDNGVGAGFEEAVRKTLNHMVRGIKPDVGYKPTRLIIARPLDLEPVAVAAAPGI
jgi:hypothetical protein